MALVNCTQCGQPVSEHAAACPHCGAPVKPLAKQATKPSAKQADSDETTRPVVEHHNGAPARKGSNKGALIAIIAVLLSLLAGGGLFYLHQQEQQRLAEEQAIEQARQDSIAQAEAAEQARREAIAAAEAAEQARQDSIAKWDFFTGAEIKAILDESRSSKLRTLFQRHGLNLLFDKEYQDEVPKGDGYCMYFDLVAGKGCEVTRIKKNDFGYQYQLLSLKPTTDVAFGVILEGAYSWDSNGKYAFAGGDDCETFLKFAFPTKEARNKVILQLKSEGIISAASVKKFREEHDDEYFGHWYNCYEENGLYWLRVDGY